MKKLLRNSLIASFVAIAGATGFAGEAKAQLGPDASAGPSDAEVEFTAEVGNLCEISQTEPGIMGIANLMGDGDNTILSSRPDESSSGDFAEVEVNCNEGGVISVGELTPDNPAANDLEDLPGYSSDVFVAERPEDFSIPDGELANFDGGKTSLITLNGTARTLYVHGIARTEDAIPSGQYAFKTTVTVTPQ